MYEKDVENYIVNQIKMQKKKWTVFTLLDNTAPRSSELPKIENFPVQMWNTYYRSCDQGGLQSMTVLGCPPELEDKTIAEDTI